MPSEFIDSLAGYRNPAVFNPWGERDGKHDRDEFGAEIRRRHLHDYLQDRLGGGDTLLLAEAIGYQGGHFSGIPMTSERLLLGGLKHKGVGPEMVFRSLAPQRTSRDDLRAGGFTEPTATIVWGFLAERGLDPYRFVLWNAFPWHPYRQEKGLLSNRTPNESELSSGHRILKGLLRLGHFRRIIAIGEKSASQLETLGIEALKVRHPANGGAGKFRQQMLDILRKG